VHSRLATKLRAEELLGGTKEEGEVKIKEDFVMARFESLHGVDLEIRFLKGGLSTQSPLRSIFN
ncbi:unnamed protein product, partial [Linum tenue]